MPAHVLHVLNGADGGAALSTTSMMAALAKLGVRSSAVCHDAGAATARQQLLDAAEGRVVFAPLYWWNRKTRSAVWKRPVHEVLQAARTGLALKSASVVARAVRRFGADLIHTNTILTPEGGLAAAGLGLPHVWHIRELVGDGSPFRFWVEGKPFGRVLARLASGVVANSAATASAIGPWLPSNLLFETIENGVDVNRFATTMRPDRAPIVVAMVGSVTTRWKKHALFIDAIAALDSRVAIDARIYGHLPAASDRYFLDLQERAAGCGRSLRFMGFVDDPATIMNDIDILVHPADGESFGRIAVEAMAASVPVVGVRGGGIGAVVDDGVTGFLADNDDAKGIARALEPLLQDRSLRIRIGEMGATRAAARFSLESHAEKVMSLYRRAEAFPLGLRLSAPERA